VPAPRRTLHLLLRVRRRTLEAARQDLARALEAEAIAADHHRQSEDAIRRELRAASCTDAPDAAVEAFAAWLPRGRAAVMLAEAARAAAEAASQQARTRLVVARTASEAAEQLLKNHLTAERAEAARQLQAMLDESVQRTGRSEP
jgi:hypothetical protein